MAQISPFIRTRPCEVVIYGRSIERRKALFHIFVEERSVVAPSVLRGGHQGGQVSSVRALVEFEDGTLHSVNTELVQFLDSGSLFEQYIWPEETEEANA